MTTTVTTALGRGLRELRIRADLTQAQVAANASVDAPYLSRVESGDRDLRWSTVLRLLDALGADLHQLADAIADVKRNKL
jgi:transcriptional regulator with XRE-family HTH domain